LENEKRKPDLSSSFKVVKQLDSSLKNKLPLKKRRSVALALYDEDMEEEDSDDASLSIFGMTTSEHPNKSSIYSSLLNKL
jgi:hypothetical protein